MITRTLLYAPLLFFFITLEAVKGLQEEYLR